MKFVITGLPRCRTAWFAAYFTNGVEHCYHEPIPKGILIGDNEGASDCGYVISPDWATAIGEHKLVIIHRNPRKVHDSLINIGLGMTGLKDLADRLYEYKGLHIQYHEINDKLPEIHEYLGIPFVQERAALFCDLRIEGMAYHGNR